MTVEQRLQHAYNRATVESITVHAALLEEMKDLIEECALIVCPQPHVEEERDCEEVALLIRALAL